MPESIKRYIDRRASNWEGMKVLLDAQSTRDLTAEEEAEWDRREAEIDADGKSIERIERAMKLEGIATRPIGDVAGVDVDKREADELRQYEEAFMEYARRGERCSPATRALLESRATNGQSAGVNSEGGYTVPPGFLVRMTETLKSFGGLINLAEVIPTSSGNPLQFPTHNGTTEVGAIIAEAAADSAVATAFGTKTLSAFTYTSNILLASVEILQDTAFPLDTWLPTRLGQRIGRALAAHFATGAGTTQPEGLATNVTTGVTAASTTAFTYTELIDLIHSVDPAYRGYAGAGPDAQSAANPTGFLGNDAIFKFARKLVDSTGRPLWEPSLQAGRPSQLLNYPVYVDQGFASAMTTGQKVLFFGNYNLGYMVRQVQGAQLMTLRERYADFRQVGYMAFSRWDAKPNDAAAVRVLKLA
jgi:HK97 family phage major capsid protein